MSGGQAVPRRRKMTLRALAASAAAVCLLLGTLLPGASFAATGIRELDTPAIAVKAPDQVALVAIANAGTRLVAVGEHGVIVTSDDNGVSWRQSAVPVDVTLTSVAFANATDGWAAGHFGIILHTSDGGLTWQTQLDGIQANQLTLAAAQTAIATNDPSPGTALSMKRANNFVAAGPDNPFLSVLVTGPQDVTVFGAYRLAMRSTDGGKTWTDWSLHIGDAYSHNLYSAAVVGPDIFIGAEIGMAFRSTDDGAHFTPVTAPGNATLFVVLPTGDNGVFVCGIAGNAYRSEDGGQSWTPVAFSTQANLTAGRVLKSGAILVVSEAGEVFISRDHAQSFSLLPNLQPMALYDVTQAANGNIVAVGSAGVAVIPAADISAKVSGD